MTIKNNSRGRHATVKTLSELSVKVLMSTKVSKHAINVSYAEYIWQDRLTKWYSSNPNCESKIYDSSHVNTNEPQTLQRW